MEFNKIIRFDEKSRVPKYRQLIDSIIFNISIGKLKMDDKLPSINWLSEELYLSRDTVEKAYRILKERKIIISIRGKGYYIDRTTLIGKTNVLFLINKLSSYKMRIYNSFITAIGPNAHVDLHIYHCDESIFLNLLKKHKLSYDYFIIMPHFKTEEFKHVSFTESILKEVYKMPKEKLIILDNLKFCDKGNFKSIYQDFENDIFNGLQNGLDKIYQYKKVFLIYPDRAVYPYPKRILHGFRKFCLTYKIQFETLNEVYENIILKKGDLFITIEENDLVNLIKQIREDEFVIGKDIGIISYNDTPLKDLFGISVISTDFKYMGEKAAGMILNKDIEQIKAPFNFINRDSL